MSGRSGSSLVTESYSDVTSLLIPFCLGLIRTKQLVPLLNTCKFVSLTEHSTLQENILSEFTYLDNFPVG